MQSISGEAIIFALGVGGFVLCLLALIALLSFFRQRRAWKEHQADTLARPPKDLAEAVKKPAVVTPQPETMPRARPKPLTEHHRLPVREATPDQIVIQIDPLEGPSRDQQNVQRLIAYLKNDSKHDAKVG